MDQDTEISLIQLLTTNRSGGGLVFKKRIKSHNWRMFCIASTPDLRHWKFCTRTMPATWHRAPKPMSGAALVSREWVAEHVASCLTLNTPTWPLQQVSHPSVIISAPPAVRWWVPLSSCYFSCMFVLRAMLLCFVAPRSGFHVLVAVRTLLHWLWDFTVIVWEFGALDQVLFV